MSRFRPFILLLLFAVCTALCAAPPKGQPMAVKPPVAAVKPHVRDIHGEKFTDDYFWLRDRKNPQVMEYIESENNYTAAMTKHTVALQETLFAEMKGRMKETDESVPYRHGDYFYYSRTVKGQEYSIHCRKRGNLEAVEEVLLDENELAKDQEYFSLGAFEVSPDHQLLAFSVDLDGSEQYTLQVKRLTDGKILEDRILNIGDTACWANDNATLFYTTLDDAHRSFKLFRHRLGTVQAKDTLLHHEEDERFNVNVGRVRSGRYVVLSIDSTVTGERWFLDADRPEGAFQVIAPRRQGVEYSVEHHDDRFFIVTNDKAVNFKLMEAPVGTPGVEHWREFLPYEPDVKLDGVNVFEKHLVLTERRAGLTEIRVCELATRKTHVVTWPEPAYEVQLGANEEFKSSKLRLIYNSMVTPPSTFDYDLSDRTRELKKQEPVLGYDATQYESRRLTAKAIDGTAVPISLVYKKSMKKSEPQPMVLYGYGSYGTSIDPSFSSVRISLLDRGVIFAIAHIRGGGEMGRPWYENGKLLTKQNTFSDFIACAEFLIKEKYTVPEKLGAWGESAGGLLMGAVTNQRPDLFKAVVANVPFVDVVNTMLDPTIPLTVTEYEEWGNPEEREFYNVIRKYSPYDNVVPRTYPHLLITAGLNDPHVAYWEPVKWTARLRAMNTGRNVILLKTNLDAGHFGDSGRYEGIKLDAMVYAFFLDKLGVVR